MCEIMERKRAEGFAAGEACGEARGEARGITEGIEVYRTLLETSSILETAHRLGVPETLVKDVVSRFRVMVRD